MTSNCSKWDCSNMRVLTPCLYCPGEHVTREGGAGVQQCNGGIGRSCQERSSFLFLFPGAGQYKILQAVVNILKSNVFGKNGTKWLVPLGHSNWTICSLLKGFCSTVFPLTYSQRKSLPKYNRKINLGSVVSNVPFKRIICLL